MAAKSKQPVVWKSGDIGVEISKVGAAGRKNKIAKLFQPVREGKCEMIAADSPADLGMKLAVKLKESKLI